jgi:hypothetical protein
MNGQHGDHASPGSSQQSINHHSPAHSQSQFNTSSSLNPALLGSSSSFDQNSFQAQLEAGNDGQSLYDSQNNDFLNQNQQSSGFGLGGSNEQAFFQQDQFNDFKPAISQAQQNQFHRPTVDTNHTSSPPPPFIATTTQPGQNSFGGDFDLFQGSNIQNENLIDPNLLVQAENASSPGSSQSQSNMASSLAPNHSISPPHSQQAYDAPSPHSYAPRSPNMHARNSLDPSSAAFPQGTDWSVVQAQLQSEAFSQHRRAPSDHSEISSVTHSPMIPTIESFEPMHYQPSPLMASQPDGSMMSELVGIEQFSLSDNRISPIPSPAMSPHLSPQHISGPNDSNFRLSPHPDPQAWQRPRSPFEQHQEAFPSFGNNQQPQMTAPEIQVDLAPPYNQHPSIGFKSGMDDNNLSPPARSKYFSISKTRNKITNCYRLSTKSRTL